MAFLFFGVDKLEKLIYLLITLVMRQWVVSLFQELVPGNINLSRFSKVISSLIKSSLAEKSGIKFTAYGLERTTGTTES